MSDLQQEQRLGKYTIVSELGRGGFATVYLARDTVLHRSVALKVLHPILLTDPTFVSRFESEARAIAQFEHPHIATIYELGHYEGRICIAIQLLPGGTLADRIRQHGPLSFADAARAIGDVAEALDHAHAAGFIHRDVKPSNILFNARGEAVLTDFGLVKAAESSVIARTTMGNMLGTPPYMAPEVWEGKGDNPRTDVYALGCVLFEMITGELLFRGDTPPAVMLTHFQQHKYPEQWPAGTPGSITALLERALAREPADRYTSAGALAAELRALAAHPSDPLKESYQALQAALAARQWEHAEELARLISAQDPGYRDVRELARQAAAGQARDEQARAAAQWREQSLAAERNNEPDVARAAVRRWLELAPGDAEAQALWARLTAARSHQPATEMAASRTSQLSPTLSGAAAPTNGSVAQDTRQNIRTPPADRQATDAGLEKFTPTAGITTPSARSIWPSVWLMALGWAIGGAFGSSSGLLGLPMYEIIGGFFTGWALRLMVPSLGWRQVVFIAIGWGILTLLLFVFLALLRSA